jgi:hypothetical protein
LGFPDGFSRTITVKHFQADLNKIYLSLLVWFQSLKSVREELSQMDQIEDKNFPAIINNIKQEPEAEF